MVNQKNAPTRFRANFSLGLALIAALLPITGWGWAYANREQFASGSLWPLPDLFLIEWTVLGVCGLLTIYFNKNRGTWLVVGALIPLFVISAWSFGFLAFLSFLLMAFAALLVSVHPGQNWLETLGVVTLGAIANLMIVNLIFGIIQKMT